MSKNVFDDDKGVIFIPLPVRSRTMGPVMVGLGGGDGGGGGVSSAAPRISSALGAAAASSAIRVVAKLPEFDGKGKEGATSRFGTGASCWLSQSAG